MNFAFSKDKQLKGNISIQEQKIFYQGPVTKARGQVLSNPVYKSYQFEM